MITNYFQNLRLFRRDVWLFLLTWTIIGFAYSGIFLVLFNLYLLRLGYDLEYIGLVNGVGMFALAGFSLPAGALGKRWGSRRMMIIGMGLTTLGFGILPLGESIPENWQAGWFVATWSLITFSAPLFNVNMAPFLMSVTNQQERNYAFSLQGTLFSLAGFIGSLIAGFLPGIFSTILKIPISQPAPFRYSLWLICVFYFVGFLTIFATREEKGEHVHNQVVESTAAGSLPWVIISILGIITLLRSTGTWGPNTFFNVYLEAELQAKPAMIGLLMAICQLTTGVASLLMPMLADRWGKERVIGWGLMGVVLSIMPLALISHWMAAEIGFIGILALSSIVAAAFSVYSQELVASRWQAVMSGANWMGMGMGASFIIIAGGRIITIYSYKIFFLSAAILTACAGLLFLGYFRKPRGEFARNLV